MDWHADTLRFLGPRHTERHQKLTEAAISVFAEYGVAETNISEIATRAGLARTQFYFAWEDRADCFTFCHKLCLDELERRIEQSLVGGENWEEKLLAGVGAVEELIRAEPEVAKLILLDGPSSRRETDRMARERAEERLADALLRLYGMADPKGSEAERRQAKMAIGAAEAVAVDHLVRDAMEDSLTEDLLVALLSFGIGPERAKSIGKSTV